MRVLLTGAAGFIGSHLFNRLKIEGYSIRGVDSFSPFYSIDYKERRLNSLGIKSDRDVVDCDISKFDSINSLIKSFKPNYVINLAAQAGVRLATAESEVYVKSNILGFHNVIRSCIENDVQGVLYASSSSVYGDLTPTPYKETSISLRPKSIYGVSKLANELFAEIQAKSSTLRIRGLRYFTVYGPWGRPDMAYFRIAAAALGHGRFTLFGDGSIKRDFTYIDDVVESTFALLKDLSIRNEGFNDVVNIGGSRPLEMKYLIDLISRSGDSSLNINKAKENTLDSKITMADNSYLYSILGEMKFTNLEQGVKNLMDWAKKDDIRPNLLHWIRSTV